MHDIKRFLKKFVRPYLGRAVIAAIFMAIAAGCTALQAWMIKPILDDVFVRIDRKMLILVPLAIIFISFVKGISSYFQNYLLKFIGQRIVVDVQAALYKHLINSDVGLIQEASSGKIISRFSNDIIILRTTIQGFLSTIAKELLTIIFLIGLMISLSPFLSMLTFVVFPLAILPVIRMGRKMKRLSLSTQESLGRYTAKLDDSFVLIKLVKAFAMEKFEILKANKILEEIFAFYKKSIKTESLASPMIEILSGFAIAAVIYYGGNQILEHNTSPGTFFAFITAFITAYKPIKNLVDLNNTIQEGSASIKRLFEILDRKPKIIDHANAQDLKLSTASIKFKNVDFGYTNNKVVLNDFSLEIPGGKMVAIIGNSGSGKSSLVNLLFRFYDASSGEILIDKQEIKNISIKSLRENISLVSQETLLFNASILDNITCGKNYPKEKIIEAAKIASAHEFIEKLENGYDSIVGQHGFKLSGGQKQRIAIARSILKDAPILILDEATSALDNITEQNVLEAIKLNRKNKTTIIIAHRLSTIMDADQIYVIEQGKLVEQGKHEELLVRGAAYSAYFKTIA